MSVRTEKVAENIKRILGSIILRELNNPLLSLLTVTTVRISADLKHAKVYVSTFDKEKRAQVLEELDSAKGRIKNKLAGQLNIKFLPELSFFIDDTMDYVDSINTLIGKIHKDDIKENE